MEVKCFRRFRWLDELVGVAWYLPRDGIFERQIIKGSLKLFQARYGVSKRFLAGMIMIIF